MPTLRSQLCMAKSLVCPDQILHHVLANIPNHHYPDLQGTKEQLEKRNEELIDLNREKSKKLSQITNLYSILKARAMRAQLQNAASDTVSKTLNTFNSRTEPTASATHTGRHSHSNVRTPGGPKTPIFPVSPEGVEQLHRHQRSGTGSSRQADSKTCGEQAMGLRAGRSNWKSLGSE